MPINTTGQQIAPCLDNCTPQLPGKRYIETIYRAHQDDLKTPLAIVVMEDTETGFPCYFLQTEIDFTVDPPVLGETININDYIMTTGTEIGTLSYNSPLTITEIPYSSDGIVLCPDGSDQDLVALIQPIVDAYIAEISAKPNFTIPDDATLGLSSIAIQQHTDKKQVHCDIADIDMTVTSQAQVKTVGLGNTSFLTVGGKKKFAKPLIDNGQCKGCASDECQLVAGDLIATGDVGTAIQIDFCIACFAPAV